jgi:membrane protein YqaA with SNARE-associated domain
VDPTPQEPRTDTAPKRPHFVRRLYDWVLHWADTRYAVPALALLSFAEASFFPIPPDPLLIAMGLGHRRKALRFAAVCSVASVAGGALGFVIGFYLMHLVGDPIIDFYHYREQFEAMVERMRPGMNLWVFVAAFTPIPYKVFTIAAGVVAAALPGGQAMFFGGFLLASALGRAGRFFLVSYLVYRFGDPVRRFIDRYFDWCALAFGVLLIGAILLVKYVI